MDLQQSNCIARLYMHILLENNIVHSNECCFFGEGCKKVVRHSQLSVVSCQFHVT